MKILVTGGSGFIGKNYILKRLDEYPDDVVLTWCYEGKYYTCDPQDM